MLLLLIACSGRETPPPPTMDVLFLTAPAADGHPPWRLELVLPEGSTDRYTGEQLIAPLIASLQAPLGACWKADDLQLTGSVVIDSDLVFDGKGSAALSAAPTATVLGKCVIAGFNADPPAALPPEIWRGAVRVMFSEPENTEGPAAPSPE